MQKDLRIVIENPKGSYKSFETEGDSIWKDYPLVGVTCPVDYGYLEGYKSEDGHDLDVFRGSGNLNGFIKVWRYDVPLETKFVINVTQDEWGEIVSIFKPVIKEQQLFSSEDEFWSRIGEYAR